VLRPIGARVDSHSSLVIAARPPKKTPPPCPPFGVAVEHRRQGPSQSIDRRRHFDLAGGGRVDHGLE